MYFQIRELILWSRDPEHEPRRIPFELGVVNVISGFSRTGKSAIIPIIDYCLGADKCTIPVNTIRDACAWFGIVVETSQGQKLLARREPGEQKLTGDMFVLEGKTVNVPKSISARNSTASAVKQMLDELARLTSLDFDAEGFASGYLSRPSFRDLIAFVFQPQNIVANPDVLFYKSNTHDHREKLRNIFPYVLGAVDAGYMAIQHELTKIQRELRKKEAELNQVRSVSERWMANIRSSVIAARELGLIKELPADDVSREELIRLLEGVVSEKTQDLQVSDETISDAVKELESVKREESAVSTRLSALRARFTEMTELRASATEYRGALQVQQDRLEVAEWITGMHSSNHDCPVCGNSLSQAGETLETLKSSLRLIEVEAKNFDGVPESFDREFERVKDESRIESEKLAALKQRRLALEKSSDEAKKMQYTALSASRFIGNVEQALGTYASLGTDSELAAELDVLRQRRNELLGLASEASVKNKLERAKQSVALNAGLLLPELALEFANAPVELLDKDLSIRVIHQTRAYYLWEVGSGSNWLGYHIAITLGLHQYFLDMTFSPVPGFIVYDQPSQVYFRKHLPRDFDPTKDDPDWSDDDVEKLHRVFSVLSQVARKNSPNFQVIVLDHAPDRLWKDLDNVRMIQEWRGREKLVPDKWLNKL